MKRPTSFVRALLAVAAVGAAMSCTVKQNESPDLLGPSSLQSPLGPSAPVARFTFAPDKPTASIPVAFDGRSSCPEGGFQGGCLSTERSITAFTWDFGDGTTDAGPTVSHSFKGTGSFNVTLTVTSDRGLASATSRPVQVDPGTPPKADFVFSPSNPGVGQSVQFNGAQSTAAPGRNIASYSWDFGDGGKGSGITATHTYVSAGGYNAVLTVTDDVGQTNAAAKSVPVIASSGPGIPTAEFIFSPTDPTAGQSVLFNATQSKAAAGHSIVSYAWNFGDGGTGSGVTANHPFGTAGTYAIVLVVTDDLNQTSASSRTVTVKATNTTPPPTASFVFSPASPAAGQQVSFNATQSAAAAGHSIASYSWNFGDGNSSSAGPLTTNTFAAVGTFNVVLKVTDDLGQTGTFTAPVPVSSTNQSPPPTASFVFSPSSPALGDTVSFDARGSSAAAGRTIVSYKWTFGDNPSPQTVVTPTTTHVYQASSGAGTYTVVLVVTDDAVPPQTGTVSQSINVGNPPAPTAKFTVSPTSPVAGEQAFFDTAGTTVAQGASITQYDWNFGDGTPLTTCHVPPQGGDSGACTGSSTANRTIAHTYAVAGSYTVNLTVTDSAGRKGSTSGTVGVISGNPTASFTFTVADPALHKISFNASGSTAVGSATIVTYAWLFGDGNSSSGGSPLTTNQYVAAGTYSVKLTVTDNLGRTGTVTNSVSVP